MKCSDFLFLLIQGVSSVVLILVLLLVSVLVFPKVWKERIANPDKRISTKLLIILGGIGVIGSVGGNIIAQLLCK